MFTPDSPGAHEVLCLALAGLPRILAKLDADPVAVLGRAVHQNSFDLARVGPVAHHIEKPVAAAVIAPSMMPKVQSGSLNSVFSVAARSQWRTTSRSVGTGVNDGAPVALEVEPGRRPDLPIAAEQP